MSDTVTSNPTSTPYAGPIDLSRPHFVGIGGVAMSALAQLCLKRGSKVTGTDSTDSDRLGTLRAAGCTITIGHSAEAVSDASCVVYTTVAAKAVDIAAARELGIPVIHRAQVLQEIVGGRELIAVAGSHGKSTTAGILTTALTALGEDPTCLVGADFDRVGSGARDGDGTLFVVEADESDRSFHFLEPHVTVITNIEHDHPENFPDLDSVLTAFVTFASKLRQNGTLVISIDTATTGALVERVRQERPDVEVITYGKSASANVRITGIEVRGWQATAQVETPNGAPVALRLNTPSRRHVHDAVAALAVLLSLGEDAVGAAEAVSTFAGMRRRFERIGEAGGVTVVDSFADHQNEITADLLAAGSVAGSGRVLAVFQPTGFARVQTFGKELGAALAACAEVTVLLGIQGHEPQEGVSSTLIGDAAMMRGAQVRYASREHAACLVASLAGAGDVVVLMGTGDVTNLGKQLLAALDVSMVQSAR